MEYGVTHYFSLSFQNSKIIFISPGPPCFHVYVCIYTRDHVVFIQALTYYIPISTANLHILTNKPHYIMDNIYESKNNNHG